MDKPVTEAPKVYRLRDALRDARVEAADKGAVVIELRDNQLVRLEQLNEAIAPLFEDIPESVEGFDRAISRGEVPRLWIDLIAYVMVDRERRLYRFIQDTRVGPRVIAECASTEDMAGEIARYIARRMVERERALAAEAVMRKTPARRRARRGWLNFFIGVALGVASAVAAAVLLAGS